MRASGCINSFTVCPTSTPNDTGVGQMTRAQPTSSIASKLLVAVIPIQMSGGTFAGHSATASSLDDESLLTIGGFRLSWGLKFSVRAKGATTAWRAGYAAQNGPKAPRRMASVPRSWCSLFSEGLGIAWRCCEPEFLLTEPLEVAEAAAR